MKTLQHFVLVLEESSFLGEEFLNCVYETKWNQILSHQ